MLNYHAASDTFDKVDITELKKHVAIAAITAFAHRRQSHANWYAAITRTKSKQLMKETGTGSADEARGILGDLARAATRAAAVSEQGDAPNPESACGGEE